MNILEEGNKELEQVNDVSQPCGVHKVEIRFNQIWARTSLSALQVWGSSE
jgi:hypothetical protein